MEMDIVNEMEKDKEKGNRKRKSRERMATWNVTGLGDHIPEIVEIMKKRKIAVLGISDSRSKGSGSNRLTETLCIRGVEETHMQIMESAS